MRHFHSSLIALLAMCIAQQAAANPYASKNADDFFFASYLGFDYDYMSYENDVNGEDSIHSGNVHAGARVNKHLGFEASYFLAEKIESTAGSIQLEGARIDMMGYLPVSKRFDLIGSLGTQYTVEEVSQTGLGTSENSEWNLRFGGGAQYWIAESVNARAMVNYVDTDNSAIISSIGLNWPL